MNSSGIKRGLAASAIASLAVTGLPFFLSSADAATLQLGGNAASVELVSPADNGVVSIKNDGTDATVRLTARASAAVSSVSFEYTINGTTWTSIGTATGDDGAFAYEWAVPASLIGAANLQVRAVAGAVTSAAADITASSTAETVNVAAGSALGVFQSPYGTGNNVVVSGTASYAGTVGVSWLKGDDTFSAAVNATAAAPSGSTTNAWKRILDISGYAYGSGDQLLVRASAATTEDTEAFSLYKQVITSVTAVAADPNVPAPGSSDVTITVKDQQGKPIAGARVGKVGGSVIGTTDVNGQVTTTQAGGTTGAYYADATDSAGYEPVLGDKKSDDLTVGQYAAAPTSLDATSADGSAFDFDEYAGGDIAVQVRDQNGRAFDTTGQSLQYYWAITPFAGGPVQYVPAKDAQGNTQFDTQANDTNGKFLVTFPNSVEGTYELYARLGANSLGNGAIAVSKVLTVKAGEADLTLKPKRAQAPIGGTASVVGTLALDDGTGLPGRSVDASYAGGNAGIVQASGNPAATRSYTTNASGSFTVDVKDPATPATAESGTVSVDSAIVAGNPDDTADIDFAVSLAPAEVTVAGGNGTDVAGTTKGYTVTVYADSDPTQAGVQRQALANTEVTLTLDHGFFTDGTDAATPVTGADAGNLKNLGSSIKVTTDEDGKVKVLTSIARDAGFDDDGYVDAKITATAGSASANDTDEWTSYNPLNGGSVSVSLAADEYQESTVLPKARNDQRVAYDLKTTDQFGNAVGNSFVALKVEGAGENYTDSEFTNFNDSPDFYVYGASGTGDLTVTATWIANTAKYDAATPPAIDYNGQETLTGSKTITEYAYAITTATATLADDVNSQAKVGQAVTETVKVVDTEGQPVQGVQVSFLRQGPGNEGTGDTNFTTSTNEKGEAYYTFVGTTAGTANVSAVLQDGTGRRVLTDAVTIGSTTTPGTDPTPIRVILSGTDNNKYSDKLTVDTTPKAAGATIRIYKITSTGKVGPLFATSKVTVSGRTLVVVKDTNGNRQSTYVASVLRTEDTKQGTSNRKTVR